MTTPADFYGVPAEPIVQQVDTITLSSVTPAALSRTGIVSYPATEVAGPSPTADVIKVHDVTKAVDLVLGTDYTLTPSGSAPESLTYSVTRIGTSTASSDGDTCTVTYRWGTVPDSARNFGDFQGETGAAPAGTQGLASVQDTEGGSAGGIGSAGGYGSLTDPAASAGHAGSEMGSPGSEYQVTPAAPSAYGWPQGAPDTEGVYGGGLPENFTPTDTSYTGTLDTQVGGGSALVSGLGTPPAYRAPSSGVAAFTKDTTLTDILGNQQNASAASPPSGYAAAQVDTSYVGAPAQPTALASQTDTFAAAQAGTAYYLSQQGLVPSSIVVTNTTSSQTMVAGTDYTVTLAGNGLTTVAYITPIVAAHFAAGNNISVAYSYGDATYWDSNVPSSVPGVPGTPTVSAVNRGVKLTWAAPSGQTPVDYYLVQASDLGTMYVPATGQPVNDGQPAGGSGGATAGQPTYQADTLTLLAAGLSAPAAPVPTTLTTGGTVLAGTYGVKVTYVNANGETVASANGSVTTTGSTSTITIPSPSAVGGATGWYAYVTQAGGSVYTRQQAAGSPTAIGTSLTLTAPPTSTGANPPVLNTTLPTTSQQGVITPPAQIIVRDTTSTENDPMQPDGTVLEYGYDYTVTQVGIGPWAQYQITLAAGSQNAASGDTIIVEYWWGADPSSISAVYTQGLLPNTPVIYKPDGSTPYSQGYQFRVAAVNRAGISNYSAWSASAVPLNYNAPQPGHQGQTQTELALDPANTINPVYKPDGTIKAGTGLGG
jgi:hypothetical protein